MVIPSRKIAMCLAVCMIAIQSTLAFTTPSRLMARTANPSVMQLSAQNDDFWAQQQALVQEMSGENKMKAEQMEKYAERRNYLLGDTIYISVLIFAGLWLFATTPFTPISYAFGTFCGLLYAYGLSKYVETLGDDSGGMVEGAGVGQARFAFLILLILFVGKFRSSGLEEIPSILGFFTYQLSSLGQGLREIND